MRNQGDVHIWKIEKLPFGSQRRKSRVVREGEATGHAHRILGDAVEVYEATGRLMAVVTGEDVSLVHEEHGPIMLEPGVYEFGPTYEYDYDAQESATLRD